MVVYAGYMNCGLVLGFDSRAQTLGKYVFEGKPDGGGPFSGGSVASKIQRSTDLPVDNGMIKERLVVIVSRFPRPRSSQCRLPS